MPSPKLTMPPRSTPTRSTALQLATATSPRLTAPRARTATMAAIAALALLALPAVSACSKNSSSSSSAGSTSSASSASDTVVARVNGTDIRESDLAMAEDDLGENVHTLDPGAKHEQLVAYVTDVILVYKAADARKNKLQDSEEFSGAKRSCADKMLMGMMLLRRDEAKDAATDEADAQGL